LGATISKRRILIVTACFLAVSVLIYWQPEVEAARKETSLQQILLSIDGWHNGGLMPLDATIREELKLDDYANNYFTNGGSRISLYIGYYLTSKNVGAAHSPLVCFPGQGWLLSNFEKRTARAGANPINLMTIVASTPQKKELLVYWFQAFERTSPSTFWQKIYVLLSKYKDSREDNAFVRVTVPMDKISEKEAYEVGVRFIEAFYPVFLDYVRQGKESR
jgi:EpsI family protein